MKKAWNMSLRFVAFLFGAVCLSLCLKMPCTSVAAAAEDVEVIVEYHQEMARPILDMINEYRTSGKAWYWDYDDSTKIECGYLPKLQYDYNLEKVAMKRAAEIAVMYDHIRPDGNKCWETYDDLGYSRSSVAENIAAGFTTSSSMHEGWMEEDCNYAGQGHRRNILRSNMSAIGIACAYSNGYYYWVEEFSSYCNNSTETVVTSEPCTVAVRMDTSGISLQGIVTDEYSEDIYKFYKEGPANSYFDGWYWEWDVDGKEYVGLYEGETIENPIVGAEFKYTTIVSTWNANAILAEKPEYSIADTSVARIVNGRIEALDCGATELIAEIKGKKFSIPLIVGHKYERFITAATENADGFIQEKCSYCGAQRGDKTVIPRIKVLEIDNDEYTYTGKNCKPQIIAVDSLRDTIDKSNYDVSYSNCKKVGTATVTVTFKNEYEGSRTFEYTINPKPVKISSVSTKDGVQVKWKKLSSQCDGYEIEYANNKAFTLNEGIAKVKGRTKISRKLKFSKRNGTRYVRIRSYKVVDGRTYYSDWSDVFAYEY